MLEESPSLGGPASFAPTLNATSSFEELHSGFGATGTIPSAASSSDAAPADNSKTDKPDPLKKCTTCDVYEEENLRVHMKSERHLCNVQRKCRGEAVFDIPAYREYLFDREHQFGGQQEGGGKGEEGREKGKQTKKKRR